MNISEFAEKAGVSKSAVSRYFNDGYLSDEKRRKIEDAIAVTGYAPSISARNVKTRITKQVGVIIPKLSGESSARVAEGIAEILNAEGYQILLANTANDHNKEIHFLDLFQKNRVDGVILLATVFTDLHRRMLGKMRVPVIIVGQNIKGYSCVCHDDEGAAYALTKLMLEKGAKSPAFIGANMNDIAAGKNRKSGFLRAVSEAGITVNNSFFETAKFSIDSGYERASHLFSQKDRPDCIFCATDSIAAGVMLYCREKGINIPEDILIASIGDTRMGELAYAPLTSAHFHYKTSGISAANMLLTEIKSSNKTPRTLQLDFEIIERKSTQKN
ncbi:MAG: LacI family DNA-binding transcriptional regulator [Clostridia bacterium]|nr:LacI family DNA-binding transcriptional regulator [Clostridia bacterium]